MAGEVDPVGGDAAGDEVLANGVAALEAEVILVVGMRLGCLNHALLTAHAIEAAGLPLAGWVANCLPPEPDYLQENITALESGLSAPLLGVVPPLAQPHSGRIDLSLQLPSGRSV